MFRGFCGGFDDCWDFPRWFKENLLSGGIAHFILENDVRKVDLWLKKQFFAEISCYLQKKLCTFVALQLNIEYYLNNYLKMLSKQQKNHEIHSNQ